MSNTLTVPLPSLNLIGDQHLAAAQGGELENINPATGQRLNMIPRSTSEDVDLAVSTARRTFDSGSWSRISPRTRRTVMLKWVELMERDREVLAQLETKDAGKPIANTRSADIPLSIDAVRYYAEAVDKITGEVGPSGPDRFSYAVHDPLGVVGIIVPWNFPLLMAMWKIAPAIAMGNSVVVKPSELTPLSILHVANLALEAGVPPGVINIVTGLGEEAGAAISRHMDVDMIAFTGSGGVGRQLMRDSGDSNLKRVALELGGKSPNIVLEDCEDLEAAARGAAWGIFYNQGQVCTAGSRLLVQRSIHREFVEKLLEVAAKIHPGDPMKSETELGSVISEQHLSRILGHVQQARTDGAELLLGGERALETSGGFYMQPTVFDQVDPQWALARKEVFGPVLAIIPFDSEDDALAIANGTEYGLASGIWTGSISKAHRFARELRAGLVWVNGWDACDITMPFGGFGRSGFGRDRSLHALYKYADLKSVSFSFDA